MGAGDANGALTGHLGVEDAFLALLWWRLADDLAGLDVVLGQEVTVVVGKGVGLFLVHSIVTDNALLVGHAERDAEDELDKGHNGRSPEDVPANDKESTDDLDPDLASIIVDSTTCRGNAKGAGTTLGGKYTGEEATDNSGNEMGMEDVEDIIDVLERRNVALTQVEGDLRALIELDSLVRKAYPWDGAGEGSEDNGTPASDETSSGRNGDETGNHALNGTNDGWALKVGDIEQDPHERAPGSANVSVEHGSTGIGRSSIRITTIESVPADPQNTSTNHHHDDVVGSKVIQILTDTRTNPPSTNETSGSRGQMNDITAQISFIFRILGKLTLQSNRGRPFGRGNRRPRWKRHRQCRTE